MKRSGGESEIVLFDQDGRRKYLSGQELQRFLSAARGCDLQTRCFAQVLIYTGCRISEALAITPQHLDDSAALITLRTLKRRRRCYRTVPIPRPVMAELLRFASAVRSEQRLWPWCRQTGWRRIKRLMADAGVAGPQATPKGLRHQFGVLTAERRIPTPLAQRWLGHAKPQTTAIYQQVTGDEERRLAQRMWVEERDDLI